METVTSPVINIGRMDEHARMGEKGVHTPAVGDGDGGSLERIGQEDEHGQEEGEDSSDSTAGVGETGLVEPRGQGKGDSSNDG